MGQAWSGTPPQQIGKTEGYDFLQDPRYQQASQALQSSQAFGQFDPNQYNQMFEQGVANPATKYYEQRIQPQLRNQYFSPSGVHTTALNSALTQGASDLGSSLAGMRANYLQQGQQTHQQNQFNAISQALGLSQARANQTQPILQESQSGWLQDFLKLLIQQGGNVASSAVKGPAGGIP